MAEISEKSFPFDAKEIYGVYDRTYLADDFARYFRAFISSGIFLKEASNLQVIANGDMTVTLKPGNAIIEGYRYENTTDIIIELDPADGVLNRVDRISATWSKADRDIHYTLQKGKYSYDPIPAECRRNAEYKDYVVADIKVNAGSIVISQTDIIDQRLNTKVCGLATPFEEIDTENIFLQLQEFYNQTVKKADLWQKEQKDNFEKWFETIQDSLSGDVAANLQKQINEFIEITNAEVDAMLEDDSDIESGGLAWSGNYLDLENKPMLNGVALIGNTTEKDPTVPEWVKNQKNQITASEIGAVKEEDAITLEDINKMFE